jgi:hypothetical protein
LSAHTNIVLSIQSDSKTVDSDTVRQSDSQKSKTVDSDTVRQSDSQKSKTVDSKKVRRFENLILI